jgi:hypothetical protein
MLLVPLLFLFPLIQDKPVSDAPAADPHVAMLAKLLNETAKTSSLHFAGSVAERAAESSNGNMAFVMGGPGSGAKFKGDIDAWRTAKKELFVLSKKRLPEMAMLDDGMQPVVRTTCADEPLDVTQACTDLTALLDLAALAKSVESIKSTAEKPEIEWSGRPGEAQAVACELPSRFIKSGAGAMQMAMPKILRIEARFTIDAKGTLVGMQFDVVRSDPFGQIRRNAVEGGGSSAVVVHPGDLGDEEGTTSVYELQLDTQPPDKRAQSILESMRETVRSDVR